MIYGQILNTLTQLRESIVGYENLPLYFTDSNSSQVSCDSKLLPFDGYSVALINTFSDRLSTKAKGLNDYGTNLCSLLLDRWSLPVRVMNAEICSLGVTQGSMQCQSVHSCSMEIEFFSL